MVAKVKLVKLNTSDAGLVISVEHEFGRLERVLTANDDTVSEALVQRIVDSFNACAGLSQKSLTQLTDGTATAGEISERVVAMSLLYAHNARLATTYLDRAKAFIAKQSGGQV